MRCGDSADVLAALPSPRESSSEEPKRDEPAGDRAECPDRRSGCSPSSRFNVIAVCGRFSCADGATEAIDTAAASAVGRLDGTPPERLGSDTNRDQRDVPITAIAIGDIGLVNAFEPPA